MNIKKMLYFTLSFFILQATQSFASSLSLADLTQLFNQNRREYTINLMWINKKLIEDQLYIFPGRNERELIEKYIQPLATWSALNPNSSVYLWYDSNMTTQQACMRTIKKIQAYTSNPIVLQDIRQIPLVQSNPEIFSDKIPVYFRADLLRLVATMHTFSTQKIDYFVYADFDMKPLAKKELFDMQTQEILLELGIILADENENCCYENGFHIISNHNKNLLKCIQKVLINYSMELAEYALFSENKYLLSPQAIFYLYNDMFLYFYHLQNWGTLQLCKDGTICDLEKDNIDDLKIFTVDDSSSLKKRMKDALRWYPTKKVDIPPASGMYY